MSLPHVSALFSAFVLRHVLCQQKHSHPVLLPPYSSLVQSRKGRGGNWDKTHHVEAEGQARQGLAGDWVKLN
jgi:hypothetical protein